jgi:adenine/guanine phosphoribosyltransferase-like PRPP-binding protein
MSPIRIFSGKHLSTLHGCGGFYSCPQSLDGKRLGPLVGYAGTYLGPNGEQLHYVGDIYANFAMAEMHTPVLKHFAAHLGMKLQEEVGFINIDTLVAAPIGGYSLADGLGLVNNINVIKAEKKVTALATPTSREKSKLIFARHNVERGWGCVIVEDVCNNFSTTEELIGLIHEAGGIVIAIVCFLNRSLMIEDKYFSTTADCNIPVVSLVRLPFGEWKQNDPAVAEDIVTGNVVWKPKNDWARLMKAMEDNFSSNM